MEGIFAAALLAIFGAFCLYTGIVSFRRPEAFAKSLGLGASGRSGRVEIQAQYGGFFFLVGLVQFGALAGFMPQAGAFLLAAVIFGGLIAGRMLALAGTPADAEALNPTIRALYAIDAAGFVTALWGLWVTA